uniref:Uncharacterized protein n=1 Tax=Aegilops tauschii subsp. strangulata TaxID=200361 RepID=A0A453JB84_AEGTS
QDGGHGHAAALSHAAALCHLLPRLGDDPRDALRTLLWRVFLPLLRREDAQPSRLQQQAAALMCDAVSRARSWDLLGATVLPFCVRSCAAAMALPTTHQYDGDDSIVYCYHWDAVAPDDGLSGEAGLLPLSRATALLASLLGDALKRRREAHEEGADASLDALVRNLTWDMSRLVLKMFDLCQEYRSCATRALLQPVLTSLADVSCVTVEFGAVQLKLSRSGFLESIWNSCVSLFSLGRPERLDAYDILSLYFSVLKSGHQGAIPGADEVQNFDLRNVAEFWDELRRGLVDKDSSVRKQAFYVLKTSLSIFSFGNDGSQRCSGRSPAALPGQDKSNAAVTKKERWANKEAKSLGVEEIKQSDEQCSSGQDRWKVFLLLYEMLQEFGTHLVEAAWTHQVLLLFESTPQSDYLNHTSYRAFHAQMESVEGIFNWMTVLWERGFTQDNPQVRCLVMQSFLDIEWERYKGYAQMVPRGFVLGPLIRGLNDVVHHKDFGVGGVYNSEAIKGAERFFSNYARKLTIRERLHLVWSLASAAKQDSFGRPGLMTLAFCIASCACQSDTHDLPCGSAVNELAKCNGDTSIAVNTVDFLDALWILSERSKHHFNPKYRLKVCEQVIKAVASLTSAAEIPLNQLFNFISTIPRECTDSTGPLRGTVQKWLLQKKECSERNTLLDELIDFPTTFMKHTGIEGSYLYDDEDVGAWEAEARRWARTLLLVTSEEHHFKQIFTFLEKCGNKLSEHSSTRKCADVKFFIIIICLIEELEVRQKKLVHQNNAIAGGGSDTTNGLEHRALTQMFEKSLLSVLVTCFSIKCNC